MGENGGAVFQENFSYDESCYICNESSATGTWVTLGKWYGCYFTGSDIYFNR